MVVFEDFMSELSI